MQKNIAPMDNSGSVVGPAGFLFTCLLFVISQLLSHVTAQTLAACATFVSGVLNVFFLIRNNLKSKRK
jgi:hypothetical protein